MSETLAEQARRKGFTQSVHRIEDDLYPLLVRPDAGIPNGWAIIDEWIATTQAHMVELQDAVNEYVSTRVSTKETSDER